MKPRIVRIKKRKIRERKPPSEIEYEFLEESS